MKTALKKKKNISHKKTKENSFPIVAIGASLGGLDAMRALLKTLPPDTGMAYIYVQHLSPDHKSLLTPILSKITKMKVQEIEEMEHMAPNNVYVIPYNKIIEVTDGHIQLLPRPKNSSTISIDVLFSSLAETHKENVIGIILSGNAQDGTLGLKAIKDAGGLTFAQDDSAQASSMPTSAIDSGFVDFVLSPEEIASELARFSQSGFLRNDINENDEESSIDDDDPDLKVIFQLLHKETGVDFNHYKMATIKRRLNHKMNQCGTKTVKQYAKLLLKKDNEVRMLYKDLLINVTNFFRDTEVFKYLKTTLLPKLLKSKNPGETLRIWVPACSTGQEAYSLAILLTELQDNKFKKTPIQIFATDLSEKVIGDARIGKYSARDLKAVSKKQLERFFVKTGNSYQIIKELRETCVFAQHNILRDPPFSRMDFISCRNLLIYFDSAAQKKVFATLHFALNDTGHLVLGKAETIGTSLQLFTGVNNKLKVYSRKKNTGIRKIPPLAPNFPIMNSPRSVNHLFKSTPVNPTGIDNAIDAVLLSHYMPACAVVNKDMEILQFRGPVSLFLQPSAGKASLNILKMTRPEFAFELRNAIHNAIKTKLPVYKSGIEIKIESVLQIMSLEVRPLEIDWDEPLLLIVFTLKDQVEKFISTGKNGKNDSSHKDQRIKKLTEELNNKCAEMNSIIESQEATYEELQAANEEIVSTNEEFQTLNEELETSKEEIETTNEELISNNLELQMRHDLLVESYEYSEAIIATCHEPMLVLTKNFHIKSANKPFYKKFLLTKEDTEGMLLFELGNKHWNIPKLRAMLHVIISKNSNIENFEVTHTFPGIGEKIMLLNAQLIVQKSHSEQLILLAFQDNTERFRSYLKAKHSHSLIEASLDPLITINTAGKITDINQATVNITGITRNKLTGSAFFNYFTEPQKARNVYKEVFAKGSVTDSPLTLRHKNGKLTDVSFNGSVYKDDNGNVLGVVVVARDLTAHKLLSKYSRSLIEASLDPLVTINPKGKITDTNEATVNITGITRKKLIGSDFFEYFTEPQKAQEVYQTVFAEGSVTDSPLTLRHKNGQLTDVLFNGSVYKDDSGKVLGVVIVARDVTEQKRIASELEESKVLAELATEIAEEAKARAESATEIAEDAVKSKQQFLSNMSHEIRTPMNAIIGFTNVVLKTTLDEKQKEYLNAIKLSGDTLIVLINDILDLAKVDSGIVTMEKTPFKLSASISAMIHLFETKIQEKNIELIKQYDPAIPEVLLGDSIRLHQIILNLISNAVKFTDNGKITVSVQLISEDKEKATIEFAISDTGIGIPANRLENIFDAFQQASSDTSRVYGGTGLGLAIVKKLVEAKGGVIRLKSKLGEGSTFSFVLNFYKTNAKPERDTDLHIELQDGLKNVKVLVVEDIVLNQLLMKTLLEDFGFQLDIAGNGRIALEMFKKNKYDIILMDLQMPEMNGFETTKHIRTVMNSKVPIIALSADVTTVDVEKCKAIGMNDYIAKPINERLLYSKMIKHLKKPGLTKKKNAMEKENFQKNKNKYINLDYLKQLTNSNSGIIEMIEVYLEETPALINTMKQAIDTKNWDSLRMAAHSIRPSFSMMGIDTKFEDSAKKIQDYAASLHAGDPVGQEKKAAKLHELFLKIETVCTQACIESQGELNALKAN